MKNVDATLLKITTKEDEIEKTRWNSEQHDDGNILKCLEIANDYYKKKYKALNRKKILSIILERLIESASKKRSSTLAILIPSADFILSSRTALLTSLAELSMNERIHLKNKINRYQITRLDKC